MFRGRGYFGPGFRGGRGYRRFGAGRFWGGYPTAGPYGYGHGWGYGRGPCWGYGWAPSWEWSPYQQAGPGYYGEPPWVSREDQPVDEAEYLRAEAEDLRLEVEAIQAELEEIENRLAEIEKVGEEG